MTNNLLFEMYVFDVGLWQSIFFRPIWNEHYNILIDVWHDWENNKHPIDFIINQWLLPVDNGNYYIWNLTITNYDHDHFSWLPYLREKCKILTTKLISSISKEQLYKNKPNKTNALDSLIDIKSKFIHFIQNWTPPYKKFTKHLKPWNSWNWDFNNLSQIVFIEYEWFNICIPWDLETKWWKIFLEDQEITSRLEKTQIFFASHHWRENWYLQEIFNYCSPNLVIVSDKEIIHSTQERTADRYWKHIIWEWLNFHWNKRKVLSTRNDWSFVFKWYSELNYLIEKINF